MALANRKELERRASARIELELRGMKRSKVHFIQNYCHIENKDIPEQMELFKLWDGQKKALQAFDDYRLNITLKARQMGLTWLALSYANHQMIFEPGYTVVGLSKREEDAKELVRRTKFQLGNMPRWLIRPHDVKKPFPITYEATTLTVQFYHNGKATSRFLAMPAAKDAGRSFTANLVIIDEWAFQQWAQEIFTAAYPTINRPTGGRVIGISTGLRGTLFEEIWNSAVLEENGFHATFLPWTTDPRRTTEWHEATKKALPRSHRQEYPMNPEDAFTAGEGAFFGEWDVETHVKGYWKPPKSWLLYRAYDYGYSSRACMKWYAVSPDGWARCYREYYPTRVRVSEQAKTVMEMSYHEDGTPEHIEWTVADTQCWTPNGETGETIADTFQNNGVLMTQADKEHHSGWARLHEWLAPFIGAYGEKTALLTFTANCTNTIRTYPSLVVNENYPEKLKDGQEDHCFVAGTLIETDRGQVPIEHIKIGDMVMTRQGFRSVTASAITNEHAEVARATFTNGTTITATPNHPFFVEDKGFLRLDELGYYDIIKVSNNWGDAECQPKEFDTMGIYTEGILNQRTYQIAGTLNGLKTILHRLNTCIGQYIGIITEKYPRATTFITRITTQRTMIQATWKQRKLLTTCQTMAKGTQLAKNTWKNFKRVLKRGTEQKKAEHGTANTLKLPWQTVQSTKKYARNVTRHMKRFLLKRMTVFVPVFAGRTIEEKAEWITKQEFAPFVQKSTLQTSITSSKHVQENVVRLKDICPAGIATVYNLSVDTIHEYYANGVLVHNCQDVDRYFCMSMPMPKKHEMIDTVGRSQQSLNQSNLPHALQSEQQSGSFLDY